MTRFNLSLEKSLVRRIRVFCLTHDVRIQSFARKAFEQALLKEARSGN